jgi:hypothetical protein
MLRIISDMRFLGTNQQGRPRVDCSLNIAPRLTRQNRTRNKAEEMVGTWRERGLIVDPGQRSDRRKQVSTFDVGSRQPRGLSAGKQPCACCSHRDARSGKTSALPVMPK